jgi:hypothetical protein
MNYSQSEARAESLDDRPGEMNAVLTSIGTYNLDSTLNSYEVEELDGHALARMIPVTFRFPGTQE